MQDQFRAQRLLVVHDDIRRGGRFAGGSRCGLLRAKTPARGPFALHADLVRADELHLSEETRKANAAVVVREAGEMEEVLARLLSNPAQRSRFGAAAVKLVREQQGATERTLDVLEEFLPVAHAELIAS